MENALREAGVHNTSYARDAMSKVAPPSVPRKDTASNLFKYEPLFLFLSLIPLHILYKASLVFPVFYLILNVCHALFPYLPALVQMCLFWFGSELELMRHICDWIHSNTINVSSLYQIHCVLPNLSSL